MVSGSERAVRRRIGDLVTTEAAVEAQTPIGHVVSLFEADESLDSLAVLDGERTRYLARSRFFLKLGQRFGFSLFEHRPVTLLAEEGSTVEADADPVEVVSLATQREPARVLDDIIVLDRKQYLGLVSMRSLLVHHKELLAASFAEREESEQKRRRLEDASRLQGELVTNLTHDIRNPLTVVLGLLELLKGAHDLPDRHRAAAVMAHGRAHDIEVLIRNLLDLSRLDAGALLPSIRDVDIASVLREQALSTEVLLVGKPVRVQIHTRSLPTVFPTDPLYLQRILANLLTNAAKFTEAGRIQASAEADEYGLILRVADTGVGIKKADLESLFQRFGRLDTHDGRHPAGNGLGLVIVKTLVEQLGGTLVVDSIEKAGTRITVRIPWGKPVPWPPLFEGASLDEETVPALTAESA